MKRQRGNGDRGVAMIELAIAAPVLVLLLLGVFEFGFLWSDVNQVERGSQNAARTGSSLGNQRFADYEALRAVESSLAGLDGSTVTRVIIYKSETDGGQVPQDCLDIAAVGTSPKGVPNVCNVYSPAQVQSDNPGSFGSSSSALTDCTAGAWDVSWCPTGRSRNLNAPHYLGVFVEVRYDGRTSIIPTSIDVQKRAIYQVEPCKAGETTC